jgi:hypothetical protein
LRRLEEPSDMRPRVGRRIRGLLKDVLEEVMGSKKFHDF